MLLSIIIILTLTALGGLFLIYFILNNKNTPKGIAIIHGCAGALGIVLLIIYYITLKSAPLLPLFLFILAACVGVVLLHKDLTQNIRPKKLALVHGLTAVVALLCLVQYFISL